MNISINLSEVLITAGKITWKFKILWIFGILAGCGASNRGDFNNSFGNGGGGGDDFGNGDLPEPLRRLQNMNWQEAIGSFLNQYGVMIVVVVSLVCLLSFLFYFLGVMGKTGLIKGAHKADLGAEKLGFGELWTESLPYFWRMVGLGLLIGLPIFIAVVILLVVFFAALVGVGSGGESTETALGGLFAALGIFVPAICCIGLVSIVASMIVEQANIAMVIEDLGVFDSLRRGWDIFKRNFLTIIFMSIILSVLGGVVGFVVALPLLLAVVPAVMGAILANSDLTAAVAPFLLAGICVLAYSPVLLIFSGIEQTYTQSALTLTYLRLTAPTPEPPPTPTFDAQ